jgi:hypothetical protein
MYLRIIALAYDGLIDQSHDFVEQKNDIKATGFSSSLRLVYFGLIFHNIQYILGYLSLK